VQEAETEPYQQDYEAFHLEEEVVPAVLSTCPALAFEPEITPEMRIWCGVLITAISDLGKKACRAAALEWIEDSENSDIAAILAHLPGAASCSTCHQTESGAICSTSINRAGYRFTKHRDKTLDYLKTVRMG
jgi:hypothetical protein